MDNLTGDAIGGNPAIIDAGRRGGNCAIRDAARSGGPGLCCGTRNRRRPLPGSRRRVRHRPRSRRQAALQRHSRQPEVALIVATELPQRPVDRRLPGLSRRIGRSCHGLAAGRVESRDVAGREHQQQARAGAVAVRQQQRQPARQGSRGCGQNRQR
jgi:hypothetical protein